MRGSARTGGVRKCVESRAPSLGVAFYNVGMQKTQLNKRVYDAWQNKLANDVEQLFVRHGLHLVFLCELGTHEVGAAASRGVLAGGCPAEQLRQ